MANKGSKGNVDPTLRALGSLGRYQLLQAIILNVTTIGTAYQLLGNIFIGDAVIPTCAAPGNETDIPPHLQHVPWNSSHLIYGSCEISVSAANHSVDATDSYPCVFGYEYNVPADKSFRAEFELVCGRKLLGGLVTTFFIMGQGIGAVINSILSDRFGRKKVMVISSFGLGILGYAVGFAPNYITLCVFRFITGACQQGVVTTSVTLSIELFPAERRSLVNLLGSTMWGVTTASMALLAFLMQHHSWRHLQFLLSASSALTFIQWWYLDESLRWLVANGRKEEVVKVLDRASRVNRKCISEVLQTFDSDIDAASTDMTDDPEEDLVENVERTVDRKQTEKLNILDIFRHKRILFNASITWLAWFTTAFSFFTLYMMSTSLHGNRFLNYFLTALMEIPPSIVFWLLVDRVGRKNATRPFVALAGVGLLSSGICRMFTDNSALQTMSVVGQMVGMFGASGMFGGVFFFTPELFPTNMRTQALGVASLAGRLGGMMAPFMTSLADIVVWAPGAMIGSLCFVVVIALHFLPETKGRELPNTVEDIEKWQKKGIDVKENEAHH